MTLLSVLVLAFADPAEGVFVLEVDKSSNWYSPGGTLPVLYLTHVNVIMFIIVIIIVIMFIIRLIIIIIIVMRMTVTSQPKAGNLPEG